MIMAVILKRKLQGKEAVPIAKAEAEKLVAQGKAVQLNKTLYEMKVENPPCDSAATKVEDERVYETKVMVAEKPKRRRRPKNEDLSCGVPES